MFILRLALRPWRLAPASQLFTVLVAGFLFFMCALTLWMRQGFGPVLSRLTNEHTITAYIRSPSAEKIAEKTAEKDAILDAVRIALGAQARRASIELVEPKAFVGQLKEDYPAISQELENLGSQMDAVVPRFVSITGFADDAALRKIRAIPQVESVDISRNRYAQAAQVMAGLRRLCVVAALGFGLALSMALVHLAVANAGIHAGALSLVRLWGGGALALRAPSVICSVAVGLLGALLSLATWLALGPWLSHGVRALSPLLAEMPATSGRFCVPMLVSGVLLGIIAAVLAETRIRRA